MNKEAAIHLIFSIIFNQSCKSDLAFQAPSELLKRIKKESFNLYEIETMGIGEIYEVLREKPCLHRFPSNMAKYIYNTVCTINDKYEADPRNIWRDKNELEIMDGLLSLSGIGRHKAIQCIIYLYYLGEIHEIPEVYIKYMQINCEKFLMNIEHDLQYIRKL